MIKKTNKKNNTEKPVAKCDQSKEVVANSCLGKRPIGPSGDQSMEVVANSCLGKRPRWGEWRLQKMLITYF